MSQPETIPIVHDVDIAVIGGASGAVSAAQAAARHGASVFVGAMETYLGEDICATGRLWLVPPADDASLLAPLFDEDEPAFIRPMRIKEHFDRQLVEAGVELLFGCYPVDVLRGEDGELAGLLLATRSGLIAVRAKQIIDATPRGLVATLAGLTRRPWPGGELPFTRIVIGPRAEGDDKENVRALPDVTGRTYALKTDGNEDYCLPAFMYSFSLPMPDASPASFAEAEQAARDRSWHHEQAWSSDRLFYLSPDTIEGRESLAGDIDPDVSLGAFRGKEEALYVLSPCADLDEEAAFSLMEPGIYTEIGARIGEAAAAAASQVQASGNVRAATAGQQPLDLREPLRADRFAEGASLEIGDRCPPVLAEMDVVVVGGGTGGGPGGIAAASEGARTLVIEYLNGLGGVGTLGLISIYYHGFREGYTETIDHGVAELGRTGTPKKGRWNPEHKSEWLRRELRQHGGQAWYSSIATGAIMDGDRITGVIVATPWGYGLVKAGAVLDCTGNADIAAAAGADFVTTSAEHMVVQGSGLPFRPVLPDYTNTDYTFIEDADPVDATRAFIVGRRKFQQQFDMAQLLDTRERRQIRGDVWLTPLDIHTGRTWPDSIALSRSNFDTHGMTIHPLFLVKPPDRASLDAYLPIGCFLPRGLSGLLVTGLALSAHRDVMPVLRMQADVQNHTYACGLAAVLALACGGEVRDIELQPLRERLADLGILPREALDHDDSFPLPAAEIRQAIEGEIDDYASLAKILSHGETALPMLQEAYAAETDDNRRLIQAKLLAILGQNDGVETLVNAIREPWDEGWNYTGMGQFGRCMSPQDDCIICLGLAGSTDAAGVIFDKAATLTAEDDMSHHRAVAIYCETVKPAGAATVLGELLQKPDLQGHAWISLTEELAHIPESHVDTATRNVALRELILARALYRCGDQDGLGRRILERYANDIRGHFSRHARAVLK